MWYRVHQFVSRSEYRREITTIIFIKLLALVVLWWVCFSHPAKTDLTAERIMERFITERTH